MRHVDGLRGHAAVRVGGPSPAGTRVVGSVLVCGLVLLAGVLGFVPPVAAAGFGSGGHDTGGLNGVDGATVAISDHDHVYAVLHVTSATGNTTRALAIDCPGGSSADINGYPSYNPPAAPADWVVDGTCDNGGGTAYLYTYFDGAGHVEWSGGWIDVTPEPTPTPTPTPTATPTPTPTPTATPGPTGNAFATPWPSSSPSLGPPAPNTTGGGGGVTGFGAGAGWNCPAQWTDSTSCKWSGTQLDQWYWSVRLFDTYGFAQSFPTTTWGMSHVLGTVPGDTVAFGISGCYGVVNPGTGTGHCVFPDGHYDGEYSSIYRPMPTVSLVVMEYDRSDADWQDFVAMHVVATAPCNGWGEGYATCQGSVTLGGSTRFVREALVVPVWGGVTVPTGHAESGWHYTIDVTGFVAFDWSSQLSSTVVKAAEACTAGVDAGCYGPPTPPGWDMPATDPNSGLWVCGPLSGQCNGKPFVSPIAVGICPQSPSVALDVVGWLSFISCQVGNIPPNIANAAIFGVNGMVDLVFPGYRAFDAVRALQDDVASRTPFHEASSAVGRLQAMADSPAGASPPATLELMGATVTVPWSSLGSALDGYRGVLALLVYAVFAFELIGLAFRATGTSFHNPLGGGGGGD